jgi:hypothetical protein
VYFAPVYGSSGSGAGNGTGTLAGGTSVDCGVVSCIAGYRIGDMDRNKAQLIDANDITAFVLALNDAEGYYETFGISGNESGDFDHNHWLNFDDIRYLKAAAMAAGMSSSGFDAAFNSAMSVPEPTANVMLILSSLTWLLRWRRRPNRANALACKP